MIWPAYVDSDRGHMEYGDNPDFEPSLRRTSETGSERRRLNLDELNGMIETAFGRGFRGDYSDYGTSMWTEGMLHEIDEPDLIARKGFGVNQWFNKVAGWIGDEDGEGLKDGSVITIFPSHAKKAIIYARLYEERTGNSVSIHFPKN